MPIQANKKRSKLIIIIALCFGITTAFVISITSLQDPFSNYLRKSSEFHINQYVSKLAHRARKDSLSQFDRLILHTGALFGIGATRLRHPEASRVLFHTIYGDGEDLQLSSQYFRESAYLQRKISQLGIGEHGPISLRQKDDWQISLTLNPYFLSIKQNSVRIYHPRVEFASADNPNAIYTIVPLGRLRLKIYDSLVSTLGPTPFYTYAEWEISSPID